MDLVRERPQMTTNFFTLHTKPIGVIHHFSGNTTTHKVSTHPHAHTRTHKTNPTQMKRTCAAWNAKAGKTQSVFIANRLAISNTPRETQRTQKAVSVLTTFPAPARAQGKNRETERKNNKRTKQKEAKKSPTKRSTHTHPSRHCCLSFFPSVVTLCACPSRL